MNIETIKFLNQLKNASLVNHENVCVKSNRLIQSLLKLLYKEGVILSFRTKKFEPLKFTFKSFINLRYFYNKAIFKHLKIMSSPSKRRYFCLKNICRISSKKNIFVFSTNKGLLTLNGCKKLKVGGVLLFIC